MTPPDAPDPHGWVWTLFTVVVSLMTAGVVIFVAVTTTGPLQ